MSVIMRSIDHPGYVLPDSPKSFYDLNEPLQAQNKNLAANGFELENIYTIIVPNLLSPFHAEDYLRQHVIHWDHWELDHLGYYRYFYGPYIVAIYDQAKKELRIHKDVGSIQGQARV